MRLIVQVLFDKSRFSFYKASMKMDSCICDFPQASHLALHILNLAFPQCQPICGIRFYSVIKASGSESSYHDAKFTKNYVYVNTLSGQSPGPWKVGLLQRGSLEPLFATFMEDLTLNSRYGN